MRMDRDLFRITLQGAVAGNHDDFERIIDLYAPLIEHHCYINGKYDEDLHQYILMRIALKISKFNIRERGSGEIRSLFLKKFSGPTIFTIFQVFLPYESIPMFLLHFEN